jgi:hypothetical protein
MADIRNCLSKIDHRTDPGFPARQVFLVMGLGRIQCSEELRQMRAILKISRNEDASEAFGKNIGLLMSSRNGKLLQTVQNSLFFKFGKFTHSDLTTPVEETQEFVIPLAYFGRTTVEDALAGHYAQFREGENMVHWFMNTTPRILVIHLARVVFGPESALKDSAPVTFRYFLVLEGFPRLGHGSLCYDLMEITAHIGRLNHGHYVTFCRIRGEWWKFDDSVVTKVSTTAVFEENFPVSSSSQTAHILVYRMP